MDTPPLLRTSVEPAAAGGVAWSLSVYGNRPGGQ